VRTPIWPFEDSSEIVNRLTWIEASEIPRARDIEARLFSQFDRAARIIVQETLGQANPIKQLAPELKANVIRYPYIAGFLEQHFSLSAQQLLLYIAESLATPDKTASAGHLAHQDHRSAPQLPDKQFAPIKFDYYSKIAIPTQDDGQAWVSDYSLSELNIFVDQIACALANVSKVSASAYDFINAYIWHVSIHKNTNKPNTFGTYTFQMLPGLLLICNPRSPDVDLFLLEESMVHEAIHCFLDWTEATGSKILIDDKIRGNLVKSPWTGNYLDIHTAYHAILVWFGLGQYFEQCLQAYLSDEHASRFQSRLDFVRRGFQSGGFLSVVEALHAACTHGASEVLRSISERSYIG
jgi:hypothetical protein